MGKVNYETLWGGLFGLIAIAAAMAEMAFAGFSPDAVAGGIKDIAGTLIVVVVLLVAIRSILPKRFELSFPERLEKALNEWKEANASMIVQRDKDSLPNRLGFGMRTDMRNFYLNDPLPSNAGWFVRLPLPTSNEYQEPGVCLEFHLNRGTFFEGMTLSSEEVTQKFDALNQLFCSFINARFGAMVCASGKKDTIKVVFKSPIESDEDIRLVIDVLNAMLQAYLVSANTKIG